MRPRIWATMAVTDRPEALAHLLDDLHRQCADVEAELVLLVVENSGTATHRRQDAATVDRLRAAGREVHLLGGAPYRRPIAASRLRQRAWIRSRLATDPPPTLIWMLDEDNRLEHLCWDGAALRRERREHHLRRLLELAATTDRPDLLIGEVCGDPPIPAAATLASRLVDLEANLSRLLDAHPDDPAAEALADLPVARDFDAYYDFSHERSRPAWADARRWLVCDPMTSCGEARAALLAEARHLAHGVALTRPLLTDPARLSWIGPGYRRGGNAVFFDAGACLEHDYPSVAAAGVHSRRGDMIGARLLSETRAVRTAGFSVRHCRPRRGARPVRAQLVRSIVSDTLGAALARAIHGDAPRRVTDTFLDARAATIHAALNTAQDMVTRVEAQSMRVEDSASTALRATLHAIRRALPTGDGWADVAARLSDRSARRLIAEYALELRTGRSVRERVA